MNDIEGKPFCKDPLTGECLKFEVCETANALILYNKLKRERELEIQKAIDDADLKKKLLDEQDAADKLIKDE